MTSLPLRFGAIVTVGVLVFACTPERRHRTDGRDDARGDGSSDAGVDGGIDAGVDGGIDAGVDGGIDAGVDGGSDAGADGGDGCGAVTATSECRDGDAIWCDDGKLASLACADASVGGTGCGGGVCVGVGEGRGCNDLRLCASGLACTDSVCTSTLDPTLQVTVDGQGTVTSAPAAIDCPGACSKSGKLGERISLTATPAAGWSFQSWSGACGGTAKTVSVTLSGVKTCGATFIKNGSIERLLAIDAPTGGSVTSAPGGIACPSDCEASFPKGAAVTLTATADENHRFKNWASCSIATTATITVTLDDAVTCKAVFEETSLVTISVVGPGRVTSTPTGIDCPGVCAARMPHGTLSVKAKADESARFVGWSGRCSGANLLVSFVVSASGSNECTATFEPIPTFPLTITRAGDGTVKSSEPGIDCPEDCVESYPNGAIVELVATAAPGSRFVRWTGDCKPWTSGSATVKVTMSEARSCRAEFVPITTATLAWTHMSPGKSGGRIAWNLAGTRFALAEAKAFRYFDADAGTFLGASTEITTSGYGDYITALAWDPTGTTIATAVKTNGTYRVQLRNLTTNAVANLPSTGGGHTDTINGVAWSPDGTSVATGSTDGTIRLWSVATGKALRNWNNAEGAVWSLKWSPDGTRLAALGTTGVTVWTASGNYPLERTLSATGLYGKLDWSADSTRVTASNGSTVFVWNALDGSVDKSWTASCRDPSFNPDGTLLATNCATDVGIWEIATASEVRRISTVAGLHVADAEWSHAGASVAVVYSDGSVRLVNGDTGAVGRVFKGPASQVRSFVVNQDEDELYASSSDGLVYALTASTGTYARDFYQEPDKNIVRALAMSADGTELAGSVGEEVHVWNLDDGAVARHWTTGLSIEDMVWSATGEIATSLSGSVIKLWPSTGGDASSTATLNAQAFAQIAWHPAGGLLASSGAKTVLLWDTDAGISRAPLTCADNGNAQSSTWSPDGTRLVGACQKGLMLWSTASGAWGSDETIVATPLTTTGYYRPVWRPDGRVIAASTSTTVQLWEVATGNAILTQPIEPGWVTTLAWSANGSRLYVGTVSGGVVAYDVTP